MRLSRCRTPLAPTTTMTTPDSTCPHCRTPFEPSQIDSDRELATCNNCGRLSDLRKLRPSLPLQAAAAAAPSQDPFLDPSGVQLPAGMSMRMSDALVLKRRWLRGKHWALLAAFSVVDVIVAYFWSTSEANVWLVVATLMALSWNYNLAAMFVNHTTIRVDESGVAVRHGPLPSLFGFSKTAAKADVQQLFAVRFGSLFAVKVQLGSAPEPVTLVAPLVSAQQAWFVEQQLERALGIADLAVEGEMPKANWQVEGPKQAGTVAGPLAALAIPLLVAGGVLLFLAMAETEVTGSLSLSGSDSWSFTPNGCVSGQRHGFGGVVLSSSQTPDRLLRVVTDPVQGNLLVVVRPNQPNRVLTAAGCRSFDVHVQRTNTTINDIRVIDGYAKIDCPDASGTLTYSGCH